MLLQIVLVLDDFLFLQPVDQARFARLAQQALSEQIPYLRLIPQLRAWVPRQIEALDLQLQDMQRLAAESKALRAMPPMPAAQAQAALTTAAQRLGDKAQLKLQGERAVLQVSRLSGEQLATWLAEVRISARVRAVEAQLTRTPQGDYSGSVVLALGARS